MEVCFERRYMPDGTTDGISTLDAAVSIRDGHMLSPELSNTDAVFEFVDERVVNKRAGYLKIDKDLAASGDKTDRQMDPYNYVLIGNIFVRGENLRIQTHYMGAPDDYDGLYTDVAETTLLVNPPTTREDRTSYMHIIEWNTLESKVVLNRLYLYYYGNEGMPQNKIVAMLSKVKSFIRDDVNAVKESMLGLGIEVRLMAYLSERSNYAILNPGLNTKGILTVDSKPEHCFFAKGESHRADFLTGWSSIQEEVVTANFPTRGIRFGKGPFKYAFSDFKIPSGNVISTNNGNYVVSLSDYLAWLKEGAPDTISLNGRRVSSAPIRRVP